MEKLTFKLRFILTMFLITAYLLLPIGQKSATKQFLKPDYTKNVFDFMEKFPYTLDYEKISIK